VHPDTTDDRDDDRDPLKVDPDDPDAIADRKVLGWGGSANPNTADGELQGMSAFADAATNARGWRRTVAKIFAWSALVFVVIYVIVVFGLATKLV